jgi:hypothetical protein
MDPNSDSDSRIYTASDISLMIGGIAAAVATIVYSCKHVSKSSCCGFNCTQIVTDDTIEAPSADDEMNSFDTLNIVGQLMNNKVGHSTDV